MARRYNIDEQTQLAEPIEIVLEGKEYKISKITTELMSKVTKLSDDKSDINSAIKQLALLLGVRYEELVDIDIRKIAKAIELITNSIREGIEAKNPSGAEAKP